MKTLTLPSTWLIILLLTYFLFDVSHDFDNGKKIQAWNEAINKTHLTGLNAGQAFSKISKLGYQVSEYTDIPRCDMNISAPYDESIISFFVHSNNPFSYCLKFDAQGNVIHAGWDK